VEKYSTGLVFIIVVIICIGCKCDGVIFFLFFTKIEKLTILALKIITVDHVFTGAVQIK